MTRKYLVQATTTEPDKWQTVEAESKREAALEVAVALGQGTHNVYVSLGQARHANGAPMAVQMYECQVY